MFKLQHCTKFGQLIPRKIIKIVAVATRSHILRLKCTKIDFGWAEPQPKSILVHFPPLGELTALPRPLAGFKGSYF